MQWLIHRTFNSKFGFASIFILFFFVSISVHDDDDDDEVEDDGAMGDPDLNDGSGDYFDDYDTG